MRIARESDGRLRAADFSRPLSPAPQNLSRRPVERSAATAIAPEVTLAKGGVPWWFWMVIVIPIAAAGAWIFSQLGGPPGAQPTISAPGGRVDTNVVLAGQADSSRAQADTARRPARDTTR